MKVQRIGLAAFGVTGSRLVALLLSALVSAWLVPWSLAQDLPDDAGWIVVAQPDAPLRCGDLDRFYSVALLPAGRVLRTSDVSAEWYRVEYPADIFPIAKSDEITLDAGGESGVIAKPTKLRHRNHLIGAAGSWWSVYAEPIPEGTPVEIERVERGGNGEPVAFAVDLGASDAVPHPPLAYIRRSLVRAATAAEVEAHTAGLARGAAGAGDEIVERVESLREMASEDQTAPVMSDGDAAEVQDTASSTGGAATGGASTDDAVEDGTTDAPTPVAGDVNTSLLMEMVREMPDVVEAAPDPIGASAQGGEGASADESDEGSSDDVVSGAQAPADGDASMLEEGLDGGDAAGMQQTPSAMDVLRRLEGSIARMSRMDEAQIEELLNAYIAVLPRVESDRTVRAVRQRINVLQIRLDAISARRQIELALEDADARRAALTEQVRVWRSTRTFTMVGRLLPSGLYDGQDLPLMYRLESTTAASGPRTLGYVRPDPDTVTSDMLGSVVGVIGKARTDAALGLQIIELESIDVLRAEG
ncbi:MAG: hypothetical protein AAF235_07350 [Planctomycetota bacterium]